MSSCSTFGDKLRYLRYNKGLSQRKLAEIIGVTDRMISDYERNKHMPSGDKLNRIAKEFGVTSEYLLNDEYHIKVVKDETLQENNLTYPFDTKSTNAALPEEYLSFRITDDSMEPRIYSGDILIVKRQGSIENNQIALISVNGEKPIIRKINKTTSGMFLIPLNNKYNPQFISKTQKNRLSVVILGRVVEIRSSI